MEKGLFLVLRLRDGVLKGGLKGGMAGGCVGYRCVGGRQNSAGRGNWKREYLYIYIYFFFLSLNKQMSLLFVLHYVTSVFFFLSISLSPTFYPFLRLDKVEHVATIY